jgi:hypothetical protein
MSTARIGEHLGSLAGSNELKVSELYPGSSCRARTLLVMDCHFRASSAEALTGVLLDGRGLDLVCLHSQGFKSGRLLECRSWKCRMMLIELRDLAT